MHIHVIGFFLLLNLNPGDLTCNTDYPGALTSVFKNLKIIQEIGKLQANDKGHLVSRDYSMFN